MDISTDFWRRAKCLNAFFISVLFELLSVSVTGLGHAPRRSFTDGQKRNLFISLILTVDHCRFWSDLILNLIHFLLQGLKGLGSGATEGEPQTFHLLGLVLILAWVSDVGQQLSIHSHQFVSPDRRKLFFVFPRRSYASWKWRSHQTKFPVDELSWIFTEEQVGWTCCFNLNVFI